MKQFFGLSALVFLVGCYGTPRIETDLEGKAIPSFPIQLSDSIHFVSTDQIPNGKSFAIYYFSPVCPYCKAQTNDIVDNIDKLKNIQFYFVTSFPISYVKNYEEEFKLHKYPNIIIGRDTAGAIGKYFEVLGVPYMAIYGKDKKLNHTYVGKMFSSQIKKVAEE